MYEITLQAMRFHALVGILPQERTTPQPIEVDLTVRVDAAGYSVDYRGLYHAVATVLATRHTEYLEEIADRAATASLALDARIRWVRVAVRKPEVALPGALAFAQVAVERSADA